MTSKNEREFVLPEIPDACPTRFPIKISPFQNCAEEKQWLEWLQIRSGISNKKFSLIKVRSLYLFSLYGECTDKYRFEIVYKAFLAGSVWDDLAESDFANQEFDEKRALKMVKQLSEVIKKVQNKENISMFEWEPSVFALYTCIETIYVSFNEIQKKRLIRIWEEHISAMTEEYKLVRQISQLSSFDEMIKIRGDSCGYKPFIQLNEFTQDIYVAQDEYQAPKFQKLINMGAQYFAVINDIVSFEREFVREKGRNLKGMNNSVAFYVLLDNDLSINDAMKQLIKDKKQLEDNISEIEDEIINEENCSDSTKRFINCLNNTVGAYCRIHQEYSKNSQY